MMGDIIFKLFLLSGALACGFVLGAMWMDARRERRESLLVALYLKPERTGLDMVKTGYGKRGTIYVDLAALEDEGLVERISREESARWYRLTVRGVKRAESLPECAVFVRKKGVSQ